MAAGRHDWDRRSWEGQEVIPFAPEQGQLKLGLGVLCEAPGSVDKLQPQSGLWVICDAENGLV